MCVCAGGGGRLLFDTVSNFSSTVVAFVGHGNVMHRFVII